MALGASHIDWAAEPRRSGYTAPAPRLMTPEPELTRTHPRVTSARLCLPESLVHERAMALAERACAMGATHSLRVWRAAHHEALAQLAREASEVAMGVSCEALFWEREGSLYHVTATFGATQPTVR